MSAVSRKASFDMSSETLFPLFLMDTLRYLKKKRFSNYLVVNVECFSDI